MEGGGGAVGGWGEGGGEVPNVVSNLRNDKVPCP